jgi:transposase
MSNRPIDTNDDAQTLKRIVIEQRHEIGNLQLLIEKLKLQIAKLKRAQFGASGEQIGAQQLQLLIDSLQELATGNIPAPAVGALEDTAPETGDAPPDADSGEKPRRRPLPSHLPRDVVHHAPTDMAPGCTCPSCGGKLKHLGDDVAEQLEYVPARFKVIRHIRPKFSCGRCASIHQANAPVRPIDRGLPGPHLLAQVVVGKYADHLPLYRQSAIYARHGVELERSTLADWVGAASALVSPLVDALRTYVMGAERLHADDTPVPVLEPGRGVTRTGRLWTYVRDDRPAASTDPPAVWMAYSPDRRGEHPVRHLRQFAGTLQADGYAGFNPLFDPARAFNGSGLIVEAACWAHVRRKFHDLWQARKPPLAGAALLRIGALYQVEREIRGRPPPVRRMVRQTRAAPLLVSLRDWMVETVSAVSAKSELAVAIRYALTRWVALTRYVDDGRVEIDNNAAERSLRGIGLGRKNWLFAGSNAGGERAAAIYSLIESAKLNDVDPQAYLAYLFAHLPTYPVNRVADLLPWHLRDMMAPIEQPLAA